MNAQPDDLCQRPDCKSIRIAPRHAPCEWLFNHTCVCDGKRDHLFCHGFVEATK